MIFYFSGTGNSSSAARKLLKDGERLISMADAQETYRFTLEEEESAGFVFPVYFYGLPDTVRTFASRVSFSTAPVYTYAVITCGGSIAGAGDLLRDCLAKNGTVLRAVYPLKMPDNYILMFRAPSEEEEKAVLGAAELKLAEIRGSIDLRRFTGVNVGFAARAETAAIYPMYDRSRKTAKFYADSSCVGCGKCAARCPAKAIEMVDGKPSWVKPKCDHCMSCLRCSAVQYGKATVGKARYRHPDLRRPKKDTE